MTCPTAPTFWRWRDIPLPRVVPRDVEFLEHAGEVYEWKLQLAAAILCGLFGIAGSFFARAFQNHLLRRGLSCGRFLSGGGSLGAAEKADD